MAHHKKCLTLLEESINQENLSSALTTTNKISLLILAGGMGSRYKGQKQVDALNANKETLMEFALYDAIRVGIRKFVFIINEHFPAVYKSRITSLLANRNCEVHFVQQTMDRFIPEIYLSKLDGRTKPLGTAHAVLCAKEVIQEAFITMNADDFYGFRTFETAVQHIDARKISESQFALCAFELQNTLSENGSVSRGVCEIADGELAKVEEFTEIEIVKEHIKGLSETRVSKTLKPTDKVSMNFWVLHPNFFEMATHDLEEFLEQHADISTLEFYLPSVIDNAIRDNKLKVAVLPTSEKWFGLTYPGDKERVVEELERKKKQGIYPNSLWENEKH